MNVSPHARERAREMGLSMDEVMIALEDPELLIPDTHRENRTRIKSDDLLLVVANYGGKDETLVTVMWWSPDRRFTREWSTT